MASSDRAEVLVDRRGSVLVIRINRAGVRNALNLGVATGIADAVDELDDDDSLRVGVLAGVGPNFSSGMDLKAFLAGEIPSLEGRGLCGIGMTPPAKPLIAAVEGWALAGGMELVLACDLVVAGRGARFGLPEVARSLVAAGGGALKLPGRVPRAVALEMLLTGAPIDASRAAEIGLVNRVVEDSTALDEAIALATTIAANAPLAVAATLAVARGANDWSTEAGWVHQAALTDHIWASEDAREGASAFAERRPPVWRGR